MRPDFIVKTSKQDLTDTIKSRLISLSVVDERGVSADTLSLTIDNSGPKFKFPSAGTDLILYLGYEGDLKYFGQYSVDDISLTFPVSQLSIRATGSRQRASYYRTKRTVAYHSTTLKHVVEEIAARNQFEARVSQAFTQFTIANIVQRNQSDSDFIVRMMQRYGVTIKPVDGKLVGLPGGNKTSVSGAAVATLDLQMSQISSGSVNLTGRRQYKAVRASYYDVFAGTTVWVREGDPKGKVMELDERFANEEEATQAAKSKLQEVQRRHYTLSLEMPGNPEIRFDRVINLLGHPDSRVSREWRAVRVEHSLSQSGFVTQAEFIAPRRTDPVTLE